MQIQSNLPNHEMQPLGKRKVISDFQGGQISSDAGGLLLRQVSKTTGLIRKFAECFIDHRNPELIEHSVEELVAQRIFGIALGYEDLNDHDELRKDPLLAVLVNKIDPTGQNRKREKDKGCPLAGKSTLNRLELTPTDADENSRYKKIVYSPEAINDFFVDHFLDSHSKIPEMIVLDVDATDDPIHGNQEEKYFHGYYGNYCYLPLYIFCGDFLLCARLRPSNIDASAGCEDELSSIITQIRARWPKVKILVRGDGGFARERIMEWCESNDVFYLFGLAKNNRLLAKIGTQLEHARRKYLQTKEPRRVFSSFWYRTLKSWSCRRRVVAKAEHLPKGANPRFVVTNLPRDFRSPRDLYEKEYCIRGDMENRIKEQQLGLFADRTSAETMRCNQLRLWFSSVAYTLMAHLRRVGLRGTKLANSQMTTIRNKLFKIGALVKITVRRVVISMSSAYPYFKIFDKAIRNINANQLC